MLDLGFGPTFLVLTLASKVLALLLPPALALLSLALAGTVHCGLVIITVHCLLNVR